MGQQRRRGKADNRRHGIAADRSRRDADGGEGLMRVLRKVNKWGPWGHRAGFRRAHRESGNAILQNEVRLRTPQRRTTDASGATHRDV